MLRWNCQIDSQGTLGGLHTDQESCEKFNPPPQKHGKHCLRFHNIKTLGTGDYTQIQAMEASVGMIAGSHKRNELLLIRHDAEVDVSLM